MPPGRSSQSSLLQALAATDRLADLLPRLHKEAVEAVDGRTSILFQFEPRMEWLQATSAYGADRLPSEPWLSTGGLVPHALFRDGMPIFVPDLSRSLRGVAEYLETPAGVLVPIAHLGARLGVLAIGCEREPAPQMLEQVALAGHAFALALERSRTRQELDLQRDVRALLEEFSGAVSSSLDLRAGLETLCAGADRLFAAGRSSVWLHNRRARNLVLSASSDVAYSANAAHVSTGDALAPAAVALRRERAEIALNEGALAGTAVITIPIKGRRRALGTFVMEGVQLDPGATLVLLERADEMGRQLSAALDNVLLLDDVLKSRRELDITFNSLTDLVAVCDRERRVVHVNHAFTARFGKTVDEMRGRPLDEFLALATQQLLASALDRAPGGDAGTVSAELEDTCLAGVFMLTVAPLSSPLLEHDPLAGGAVLVARDVTPRARLEAERAELRNKLLQSEKLAALGEFVAGIAHELNNPLQGVLGHLELLRATGELPRPLRREVQRIYREADRAAKIVRNLLVFAGSRRFVRRRTSVNAVLSRVLAFRAPAFRAEGIEIVRHLDEALPRVKADPLLLQQAFLNIVLNAEQSIGTDGRIDIRTSFVPGTGHVTIEVRDSGAGIPDEVLPRIFEPFYTTKDVGHGTGLGLAIVYGIIQEHGGQISASNHPEGGAVFTVQLPLEPDRVISLGQGDAAPATA